RRSRRKPTSLFFVSSWSWQSLSSLLSSVSKMLLRFAAIRFRFSQVQRVPVRILKMGDEELRVVDNVTTKDHAACLERRHGFADWLARVEADRHRSDAPCGVLRGSGMQADRQPVTAINRCPVVAEALEQLQPQRLEVSRNTVMAAYEDLAARGLLVGRTGAGSFVGRTAQATA